MYCSCCGGKLEDNWVKCPFCGQWLNDTENKNIEINEEQCQSNNSDKRQEGKIVTESKKTYTVSAWRRTNKFSFENFTSDVEIEGKEVHVTTWIKRKVIKSDFSIDEIENMQFKLYPIWLISDIIRIVIFGLCLFISYGLSVFAILLSVWLMVTNHLVIKLKNGKEVKIPVSRKADIVDLLTRLGYPKEGIMQIEQKSISENKSRYREWIFFTLFLIIAGVTLSEGLYLMSARMANQNVYNEAENEIVHDGMIQNGYLATYNTVTIDEVLRSYWEDGEWVNISKDEIMYAITDGDYKGDRIQFSILKDGKSFIVSKLIVMGYEFSDVDEMGGYINGIYNEYANKYPDKGLLINLQFTTELLNGTTEAIMEPELGELYNIEISKYMGKEMDSAITDELSIQEADMGEFVELQGTCYSDELMKVILLIDGNKHISGIQLSGSTSYSPKFQEIRIGDNKKEALMKLDDKFTVESEENMGMDRKIILVENVSGRELEITYSYETEKINKIEYYASDEEYNAVSSETYIFQDSDKRYLSEDEIRSVEADKLMIGRNEIFARHGRKFNDPDLNAYFSEQSWYEGTVPAEQFDADAVFNDYEKKNVELIKKIEDEVQGSSGETIDPTIFYSRIGKYSKHSAPEAPYVDVTHIEGDIVYFSLYGQFQGQGYAGLLLRGCPGTIVDNNTIHYRGIDWGNNGYDIYITWEGDYQITVTGTNPDCYDLNGSYSNTAALQVS